MIGPSVVVTGVGQPLGEAAARGLAEVAGRLVGMDIAEPARPVEGMEFVPADIRDPLSLRSLQTIAPQVIVHLALSPSPGRAGGRAAMKDRNVIGTMRLMSAARHVPRLTKLVVRSSSAVYGADPEDPALFVEGMPARSVPHGYTKDAIELEEYVRRFARRRPEVSVTILRFANLIGAMARSPIADYLSLPVVPTAMGFDPRMQFLHEDDAVAVLRRMVVEDHPGTFNVAGQGVLLLSQVIRICGRVPLPLPLPLTGLLGVAARRTRVVDFPEDQFRLVVYGRVMDGSKLRAALGDVPRLTGRRAVEEFAAGRDAPRPLDPRRLRAGMDAFESLLRRGLERVEAG